MIVGAQKAGTTALARFLEGHPEICISRPKEVHAFDSPEFVDGWSPDEVERKYRSAFAHRERERRLGEATPIYLYWPVIPRWLQEHDSETKMIVLLRDPVERALSHYVMEAERGNEELAPLAAMLREPSRLRRDRGNRSEHSSWRFHSYQDRGHYRRQLQNLYRSFPRDQVLVLRSESLWSRHAETLRRVHRFLGVDQGSELPERERIFPGNSGTVGLQLARAFLRARLHFDRRWLDATFPA